VALQDKTTPKGWFFLGAVQLVELSNLGSAQRSGEGEAAVPDGPPIWLCLKQRYFASVFVIVKV